MPKTVILDVFSGTGSIAKAIRDAGWTDEYFVIELDMEPKSEPMDNVITLNCDTGRYHGNPTINTVFSTSKPC